jgi:hypothetical protein
MHQFALEAFERVVAELHAASIPVLAVKGIALADTLYTRGERFMVDVDLRVVPEDLARAEDVARTRGWRVHHRSKQWGTFEIDLGRDGPLVEVESTIGAPGVCNIDVRTMIERGVARARGNLRWVEPEIHDHALLLCINVFKDKLVHARPWSREDLIRLAEQPSFSPEMLVARANEARLRELVAVVSAWLPDGARWADVHALLDGGPRRRAYGRLFLALGRWRPDSRLLALIARAASDDPRMRVEAVFWGALGTARFYLEWPRKRAHRR